MFSCGKSRSHFCFQRLGFHSNVSKRKCKLISVAINCGYAQIPENEVTGSESAPRTDSGAHYRWFAFTHKNSIKLVDQLHNSICHFSGCRFAKWSAPSFIPSIFLGYKHWSGEEQHLWSTTILCPPLQNLKVEVTRQVKAVTLQNEPIM